MREMNAAKKALADARAHLAELEQRIADQAEELETRQDIAGRYDQIVADQRRRLPRPKRLQRPPRLTVMPTPPKRQSSRVSSNK